MRNADASRMSASGSEFSAVVPAGSESPALLQQVLDQRGKTTELTHREYGLRRWKEYAVLKHGNNARFQSSIHGREMIKIAALREHETEMSQMHQQVRSLQTHVQSLEQELTRHKERVKEYEHTIERLAMQNTSNATLAGRKSCGGKPAMDTQLLKNFLHGTSHSNSLREIGRADSHSSEFDGSSLNSSPSPHKTRQGNGTVRSVSSDDMLQGLVDDLRTMTAERDQLHQQLKTLDTRHKREIQRLRLRCSIAESESVTLKAKLQGMGPADVDVLANPTLRKEVDRVFDANDKLALENRQLRALLVEVLHVIPAEDALVGKIQAKINEGAAHDDSGSDV